MMHSRLISTRDKSASEVSLKEAILTSQPPDGGLFVFPKLEALGLEQVRNLDFKDLAKAILGQFDFGISVEELNRIIESAYGEQWESSEITPLRPLLGKHYLLELFHGPTQAFKDIALQFLPRLLSRYQADSDGRVMRALGASSGDTISAAHFGVGDVPGLQSIFLLPEKGPSEIQLLQAVASGFRNVMTILIQGSFDDGQKIIKEIMSQERHRSFKEENNFISFNSINIARILAQIVYYFSAYLQLVSQKAIAMGDPVNFSVPSGNFGDALAGVYAQQMGLPIEKINVATNKNHVLHQFLETGEYRPGKRAEISLAPSQDITTASNFERMLFLVLRDPKRVVQLMSDLKMKGFFRVEETELRQFRLLLESSSANDLEIKVMIESLYRAKGIIIDPHTATGIHGALKVFSEDVRTPTITLATASHIKFPQPEGVPRDDREYERVVAPLRKNEKVFLRAEADEASIVAAIQEAVRRLG